MSVHIVGYPEGFTKTTFPGGESCIRVTMNSPLEPDLTLELAFENNGDLFDLALLADACRRKFPTKKLKLWMGYAPYARQDRVCNEGESLSIKVVADFINALNFEAVCILDPHSDVTAALFNNTVVHEQWAMSSRPQLRKNIANTIIVAPDSGASKKAHKFAQEGGFVGFVQASKVRDLASGKIVATSTVGIPHIGNQDFLIVDDILDAGGTFVALATELRKLTTGKICLYVTHGLFSAGVDKFHGVLDKIYVANDMRRDKANDTYGILEKL
jgi:ribose-phosphate pyrophosphokinase